MSTGLECQLVEWERWKWYYILERESAPKCAWDWREYADAYGPFRCQEAALENLAHNHANPGGYSVLCKGDYERDEVLTNLIAYPFKPTAEGGVRRGSIRLQGPCIFFD